MKDFETLGVLGEGSFGKVYHVVSKSNGDEYALKVISKKSWKGLKEQIQREKQILSSTNHSGIIKLYQCFHDAHNLYFLMELAINGELFSYMKKEGVIEHKQAQFMAAEIISMIEYLQSQRICHRDIKPANLLFDSRMRLKLVDFGTAKYFKISDSSDLSNSEAGEHGQSGGSGEKQHVLENAESTKRLNSFVGTCEYMSPEIIQGKCAGNEWDLWGLGVIIYKFFAEHSPFRGAFEEETLQKIEDEPVEFPENFPEVAKDLWSKLLEKDPWKRLGWGQPGSWNDLETLKSHPFFKGINFKALSTCNSPVPVPKVIRSSIKKKIIEKYKDTTDKNLYLKEQIEESKISRQIFWNEMKNICYWKEEWWVKTLFCGDLKYRSKLFLIFLPVHVIVSDEPAMYLYKPSSGNLKVKYELNNYYLVIKSKTTFKLIKKGENEYRHIENKFKLVQSKQPENSNQTDLLTLLKKFTIQ